VINVFLQIRIKDHAEGKLLYERVIGKWTKLSFVPRIGENFSFLLNESVYDANVVSINHLFDPAKSRHAVKVELDLSEEHYSEKEFIQCVFDDEREIQMPFREECLRENGFKDSRFYYGDDVEAFTGSEET
jgi:hypothetical protein